MNSFRYLYLFGIVCTLFLVPSCSDDKDAIGKLDYSKGTWIVNQGKFQDGTGTLTYYYEDEVIQDVFGKENNGAFLGNIVQSIIKVNQKYYIAVNNADKIVVVDAQTFKFIKEINMDYPRYFASDGNKLYISGWNKDFTTGAVYEIDLQTDDIKNKIDLPKTAEGMTISNNTLYITMTDVSLKSKEIAIINMNDNSLVKTLEVCDNPHSAVTDNSGHVWVLCAGHSDWQNPIQDTKGALVQISNANIVISTFSIEGSYLTTNGDKTRIFTSNGLTVTDFSIFNTRQLRNIDMGSSHNGIGISPLTDKLFATTSDFTTKGEVILFDYSTSSSKRIPAGVGASYIYFVE